jgi:hypothetical protein
VGEFRVGQAEQGVTTGDGANLPPTNHDQLKYALTLTPAQLCTASPDARLIDDWSVAATTRG